MSAFADKLVEIAYEEVGVMEDSENYSPRIREYQLATAGIEIKPWSWCAAFTAWCLRETLNDYEARKDLYAIGVTQKRVELESWRCKSARAFSWETWALSKGHKVIPDGRELAKKGDFVVYDFSHIGIVAMDQASMGLMLVTIEGNTNLQGSREGDGVYVKTRKSHPTVISSFIRIAP